jgi:hypothetical protein
VDGEAFVLGIEARPSRYGPTFEDAIQFQTKIIVQAGGGVFLDNVGEAGRSGGLFARGLACLREVALGDIGFKFGADVAFTRSCRKCPRQRERAVRTLCS